MSETFYASRNSIETFNQCKYKFFLRYVKKDKGYTDFDDKKSALFGSIVHKVLELYHADKTLNVKELFKEEFKNSDLSDKDFFDKGLNLISDYSNEGQTNILGLETPFQMYLTNGIPVKGIIDRIDKISDDEIEVIDYKTGMYHLNEDELRRDIQLGLYDLVARILFPQYKRVKLTLNYLHFGKVSIYKTDEERSNLEDYISVIYEKIQSSTKNATEATMTPKVNSLCSFCEYKHKCPEFQSLLKSKDIDDKEFSGLIAKHSDLVIDQNEIPDFINSLKSKIKILKNMQDQANAYIKESIKNSGEATFKLGKKTYYLASKKYTKYNVNTVVDIFKAKNIDLNFVLEPLKAEIDKILIKDAKSLDKLQKTSSIKYSDSYVK